MDDARDARRVATRLGIPFYVVDVSREFGRDVIDAFVTAYAAGSTPNPCIACNRSVKFGRLRALAAELGAEAVATGHYARTASRPDGGTRLLRPLDRRKDQTYVLYSLEQGQLAQARFPLGDSTKDDVRTEARALGLLVADKPDSQELCFVPGGDHRAVLVERAPELFAPGAILDEDGRLLGRHDGAVGFTVGQRRGLGVSAAQPLYVRDVDTARNVIVLASRRALERRVVRTEPFHFVDVHPAIDVEAGTAGAAGPWPISARVRHAMEPVPATLSFEADGSARVVFGEAIFAPAPGQALVAYRGDAVLGGAPIVSSEA